MVQSPVQSVKPLEDVCMGFAEGAGIEFVAVPHDWFFNGRVATAHPYVDDPRLVRMQPPIRLDLSILEFWRENGREAKNSVALYGHNPSGGINAGYLSFDSNGRVVEGLSVETGGRHVFVSDAPDGRGYTVCRTDKTRRDAKPSVIQNMRAETVLGYLNDVFKEQLFLRSQQTA